MRKQQHSGNTIRAGAAEAQTLQRFWLPSGDLPHADPLPALWMQRDRGAHYWRLLGLANPRSVA